MPDIVWQDAPPDIVWDDEEQLEERAKGLREANPGMTFVVEDGTVWLRENGKDYGIYSRDKTGWIVCVLFRKPSLVRKTPRA